MDGQKQYTENFERMINRIVESRTGEHKELLKGFLSYLRDAFAISSKYSYIRVIDRFLERLNKKASEIRYEDYTDFLSQIADKSSTYKIMTHAALKNFSEYLKASRRNDENAMQYVKVPKTSKSKEKEKKEKRLNNVLHDDEIKQYIRNVENGCGSALAKARQEKAKERDRCIIEIFLTTGMRCSALYKINVNDIDLENRTITVLEKRDKLRTFVVPDKTRMAIEEWLTRRDEILDGKEEDALFISNQKRRLDSSCIRDITHKYGEGIKNITPHKLRATFGTQLLDKTNGDLDKVRIAMGHNSVATTELYMRRDEKKVGMEIADLMEDII